MQYMYPYDIPMFPVIPFLRLKKQKNTHFELQLFFLFPRFLVISGVWPHLWLVKLPLFMVEAGEAHTFSSVLLRKNYTRSCVTDVPGLKHDKIQTNIYIYTY